MLQDFFFFSVFTQWRHHSFKNIWDGICFVWFLELILFQMLLCLIELAGLEKFVKMVCRNRKHWIVHSESLSWQHSKCKALHLHRGENQPKLPLCIHIDFTQYYKIQALVTYLIDGALTRQPKMLFYCRTSSLLALLVMTKSSIKLPRLSLTASNELTSEYWILAYDAQ